MWSRLLICLDSIQQKARLLLSRLSCYPSGENIRLIKSELLINNNTWPSVRRFQAGGRVSAQPREFIKFHNSGKLRNFVVSEFLWIFIAVWELMENKRSPFLLLPSLLVVWRRSVGWISIQEGIWCVVKGNNHKNVIFAQFSIDFPFDGISRHFTLQFVIKWKSRQKNI